MASRRWSVVVWVLVIAAVMPIAGRQTVPPLEIRARIDAFFEALASGDPQRFERMAQENWTPEALAQRTPDSRRQFVERVREDFGQMTRGRVTVGADHTVEVVVTGSKGAEGTLVLSLEAGAPYRILKVGMRVEAGGGERGGPGGGSRPAGPPPPPLDGSMAPAQLSLVLDEYLSPLAASGSFSGVVLAAKNGTAWYEKPYGLADRAKQVAIKPATRFNLGSINKIFTKVAIGQLVAQEKLALTDTIGKLLPDYPNRQALAATVEQLLRHRAGVADFFGPDFNEAPKSGFRSNRDYYRFVAPKPLLFEPGSRMQYCNGCYIVLGAIIERVSGLSYEDYVSRHVFEPAGMRTAAFLQVDRSPIDMAIGYTRQGPEGNRELRSNEQMHGAAGSAAGGAYATVADLLAFDNALRGKRLLDEKMTLWVLEGGSAEGGRAMGSMGIAGGAPGCSAVLESDGVWTVVVLGNLDPPSAEQLGGAIFRQLANDTRR